MNGMMFHTSACAQTKARSAVNEDEDNKTNWY